MIICKWSYRRCQAVRLYQIQAYMNHSGLLKSRVSSCGPSDAVYTMSLVSAHQSFWVFLPGGNAFGFPLWTTFGFSSVDHFEVSNLNWTSEFAGRSFKKRLRPKQLAPAKKHTDAS